MQGRGDRGYLFGERKGKYPWGRIRLEKGRTKLRNNRLPNIPYLEYEELASGTFTQQYSLPRGSPRGCRTLK